MSSRSHCPSDEDLVLLTSGELPPGEWPALAAHVRRCAPCRHQVAEIENTLALCAIVLAEQDGRAESEAMYARFAPRLHAAQQAAIHAQNSRRVHRWLPVAAALLCAILLGQLISRTTAVLSADEVLSRIAISEDARTTVLTPRIDVRVIPEDSGTLRVVSAGVDDDIEAAIGTVTAKTTAVATGLIGRYVTWPDPLSIKPVRSWSASLAHKREHVTRRGPMLTVAIVASEGPLRRVEIEVDGVTYRVVQKTLVFEKIGRVEIRAAAPSLREARTVSPMSTPAPQAPTRDTLLLTELEARLVLRATNLDTTSDVRITTTSQAVRVAGMIHSQELRRTVASRLATFPHVDVALESGRLRKAMSGARDYSAVHEPPDRATNGTRVADQRPMVDVVRRVTNIRGHAAALNRLAQRYPHGELSVLSPSARTLLQRLLDSHYRALDGDIHALQDALEREVRVRVGGPSPTLVAPVDWATRAGDTLERAMAFDLMVQNLLTGEARSSSRDAAVTTERLHSTFLALREALASSRP